MELALAQQRLGFADALRNRQAMPYEQTLEPLAVVYGDQDLPILERRQRRALRFFFRHASVHGKARAASRTPYRPKADNSRRMTCNLWPGSARRRCIERRTSVASRVVMNMAT